MGLVTDYPLWFTLLCLLLGAAYSFALYFGTRPDIPRWLFRLLAAFRFLSVAVISFLLLSPLIRQRVRTVERPVIIIGMDRSRSVGLTKDSTEFRKQFPGQLEAFVRKLGSRYDVHDFSFGRLVSERTDKDTVFDDPGTDISGFFTEAERRFNGRNVGAVVLLTDGIYNRGTNPVYAARKIPWPVYTVALGDTIQHRDVILKKVTCNRQAFLGDRFPMEIQAEALMCEGEDLLLQVKLGDRTVSQTPIPVQGERFSRKVLLHLDAAEAGLQHYSVSLSRVEGEHTNLNNTRDVVVEVLEQKYRIAILYDAPHPDVSALAQALESGIRFGVTETALDDFKEDPREFDLIILYQIPSVSGTATLDRFLQSGTSLLFVVGTRSDLSALNRLKTGIIITSRDASFTESQPAVNSAFPLFTLDREMTEPMREYPPLSSPFGVYQSSGTSEVLVVQKIGSVISGFPMIAFFRTDDRKTGVIAGENLWRWRISNFMQKGNHDAFNLLVGKIALYLSVSGDNDLFRVKAPVTVPENEQVLFSAELLNESYELTNEPDVNLMIRDRENRSYPFVMSRNERGYSLKAGVFPPGNYSWEARVTSGKTTQVRKGFLVVSTVNLEALNVTADHRLLKEISREHDGFTTTPAGMDSLAVQLLARKDIASVSHHTRLFTDLTGNIWPFLLIMGLLTAEWAFRKRSGM